MDCRENAKIIIKLWNSLVDGDKVNATKKAVLESTEQAVEKAHGDIAKIRRFMTKHLSELEVDSDSLSNEDRLVLCMSEFVNLEEPEPESEEGLRYSMSMLEQTALSMMAQVNAEDIEKKTFSIIEDKLEQFIKDTYGVIERKVVTVIDDKPVELEGVVHEKFDEILQFMKNDESVYLVGPSGSGKSVLCKQIADALGLEFYFSNCVTREHMIDGFTDAKGNYHQTQFYKAFVNGGLFFLDEMDASIPEVLVKLNGALANGWYDFPAPIGKKYAHEDFKVIAAGNTSGQGASIEYVGRNQLDAASLDRFVEVTVDYCDEIEKNVTLNNKELIDFCRDFRKSAKTNGLNIVLSYRGMGRIAKMEQIMELKEVLKTCLIKGLDKDDVCMLLGNMRTSNKYVDALRELSEVM